eukprot:214869_1
MATDTIAMCLYDSSTPFECIECSRCVLFDELYVSPNCFSDNQTNHYYCIHCASKIINESLSLLNETPKCIISSCNKSFNVSLSKVINHELFSQYQLNDNNISQYKNDEFLLYGYIRENKKLTSRLFPKEIIALIHDFYKLVFFTKLPCDNCNNTGYDKCHMCNGKGNCTSKCTFCTNGSITKTLICPDCENGKQKIRPDCRCFLNYYAVCRSCDGFGWRVIKANKKIECKSCNGLGNFCDCMSTCNNCNGLGKLNIKSKCIFCDSKGNAIIKCIQCDGSSIMECYKCESKGNIWYTDFKKVISKQSYCNKCNIYKSNNDIIYWSKCRHTYCYNCVLNSDKIFKNSNLFFSFDTNYIERQLSLGQIPMCLMNNCCEELVEKDLKLIYKFSSDIHGKYYWNDNKHINNLNDGPLFAPMPSTNVDIDNVSDSGDDDSVVLNKLDNTY